MERQGVLFDEPSRVSAPSGTGEPEFVEYGIMQEDSDIRIHVCVDNQTVYIFRTQNARAAIRRHTPRIVPAYQVGVEGIAGHGWVLPPGLIEGLRTVAFPEWAGWSTFAEGAGPRRRGRAAEASVVTSERGRFAEACVQALLAAGKFPLSANVLAARLETVPRVDEQIRGIDFVLVVVLRTHPEGTCRWKLQVKFDGPVARTGNLYLQKDERNPLKRH